MKWFSGSVKPLKDNGCAALVAIDFGLPHAADLSRPLRQIHQCVIAYLDSPPIWRVPTWTFVALIAALAAVSVILFPAFAQCPMTDCVGALAL